MKHVLALFLLILVGCSTDPSITPNTNIDPLPPVGETAADGTIVKARAAYYISTERVAVFNPVNWLMSTAVASNPGVQLINVVLATNVNMTMDSSAFALPVMSNALLDFGYLNITALHDNDLKHCGGDGNQKCTTALFRVYTSGTTGAGLWNAADGYGAPITVSGTLSGTAGLGAANSVIVQTWTVPGNRNTVKVTDFSPAPHYNIRSDFSDAGSGSYSTTVNVEFALAP